MRSARRAHSIHPPPLPFRAVNAVAAAAADGAIIRRGGTERRAAAPPSRPSSRPAARRSTRAPQQRALMSLALARLPAGLQIASSSFRPPPPFFSPATRPHRAELNSIYYTLPLPPLRAAAVRAVRSLGPLLPLSAHRNGARMADSRGQKGKEKKKRRKKGKARGKKRISQRGACAVFPRAGAQICMNPAARAAGPVGRTLSGGPCSQPPENVHGDHWESIIHTKTRNGSREFAC